VKGNFKIRYVKCGELTPLISPRGFIIRDGFKPDSAYLLWLIDYESLMGDTHCDI